MSRKMSENKNIENYSRPELPSWGNALQFPPTRGGKYVKEAFKYMRALEATKIDPVDGKSNECMIDAYALFGHPFDTYLEAILGITKQELFQKVTRAQHMTFGHFMDIYGNTAELLEDIQDRTEKEDKWLSVFYSKLLGYINQLPIDFEILVELEYSRLNPDFVENIAEGELESELYLEDNKAWSREPVAERNLKGFLLRSRDKLQLWIEYRLLPVLRGRRKPQEIFDFSGWSSSKRNDEFDF